MVSSVTPWTCSNTWGYFWCKSEVRSPPSSRIILAFHGSPSFNTCCSRHQSYSSSVSPFQANTGVPLAAIAAAAWSWVEKILQEVQRTSAPRDSRVSISTAVWMVIWIQPKILAPDSGCSAWYLVRSAISAGISDSAMEISFLPHSAKLISATL